MTSVIKILKVNLADRSYDIIIGKNLFDLLPQHLPQKKTFIITDENVAKHHLKALEAALTQAGIEFKTKILPAGEQTKSYANFEALCDFLLSNKVERKTTILAFGGGVIGDLVGFTASAVLRGINFIQIPTTLLSQVDSSVGGKTAINSKYGKNLVGAFYQPKLVLADIELLKTLPQREFLSGYAEVVKYGLINNPDFFNWLDTHNLSEEKNLSEAIFESCKSKADVVSQDEKEGNIRALLNLGHTFGHAFEAETGYSEKLLHGEAVALGTIMAFKFSAEQGLCSANDANLVEAHFKKIGLPTNPRDYLDNWNIDDLIDHMRSDKKVSDGKMVFILARGIGKSFISKDVSETDLRNFLKKWH